MKKVSNGALRNLIMAMGMISVIKGENCYAAAENNKRKREVVETGESALVMVAQDQDLESQLMQAVQESDEEKVAVLLEAKASVNTYYRERDNGTVLMQAACTGNMSILNALLGARADVNMQGNRKKTALLKAVYFKNTEMVKALLIAGADVDKQDTKKETALMKICKDITSMKIEQVVRGGEFIEDKLNSYKLMRLLLLAGAQRKLCNVEEQNAENMVDGEGRDYIATIALERQRLERGIGDNRDQEIGDLLRDHVAVSVAKIIIDYEEDYQFLREREKNRSL